MPEDYQLTRDDIQTIRRLIALFRDITQRYGNSGEIIASLPGELASLQSVLRELIEESSNRIESLSTRMKELDTRLARIEFLETLEHTGHSQSPVAQTTRQTMSLDLARRAMEDELKSQQELLAQHHRNLSRAKIKLARQGVNQQTDTLNEIETYELDISETEEAIKRIKKELG